MATTETTSINDSRKTVPESRYGMGAAPAAPPNYFGVDFALRLLLLACSVTALVVMVTSDQTKQIPTMLPAPYPPYVSRDAKFNHSPAFIYLVAALAVTILYSLVTMLASASVISNPSPSPKLLFLLILFDALMAGIMASAMGSAAGVAYIGVKGNVHVNWMKICDKFGKYCRYVGSSVALSLAASVVLVLLVVISSYSMYRRSR